MGTLGNTSNLFSGDSLQFDPTGTGIKGSNGKTLRVVGGPKKIIAIGDSIVEYCQISGRQFAQPTTLTGIILQGASLTCPTGNATLAYSSANKTLTWTAPGDTAGQPVLVSQSGIYYLESGSVGNTIRVAVKALFLPATDISNTLASGVIAIARNTGGWIYAIDTLTRNRFQFLPHLGISGDTTAGMVGNRYNQAVNSDADIVLDVGGTNDIQLSGLLPASIVANRSKFWSDCGAAGKIVLAFLISPRWGRNEAGVNGADVVKYSATLQARIVATNRLLIQAAASMPWVRVVDTYSPCVDATQTTGRVKDGWTPDADGLHPGGAMAFYGYAQKAAAILNNIVPDDSCFVNVGAGSYYDAVNNPGGNLLNTNQGALAGTGGSAGTGVTVGTGLAAGVSASRANGTTVVAVANKVVATDGGADWQEFVVSGATVNGETIGLFLGNPTFSRMTAGDPIKLSMEFQIVGTGCYGVYVDYIATGSGYTIQAYHMRNNVAGLNNVSGVLATDTYVIQPGVTDIFPRIFVQSVAGASFSIRYRNVDLRKVV